MSNPTPNAVLGATDDGRLRIHCPACEWDATYPSLDAVTAMQIVRQHAGDHAAKAESERDADVRVELDGFVAIWHDATIVQHDVDEIRCQACRAYMAGPLKSPTTLADLVAMAGSHKCLPYVADAALDARTTDGGAK